MTTLRSTSFLADFGINSVEILKQSIITATQSKWNHNHSISASPVSNSIVLSACLFGSICLFSTALIGINKKWIKEERHNFVVIDGLNLGIICLSGFVIVVTATKAHKIIS